VAKNKCMDAVLSEKSKLLSSRFSQCPEPIEREKEKEQASIPSDSYPANRSIAPSIRELEKRINFLEISVVYGTLDSDRLCPVG
jgi:hypothetical protein